MRAVKEHFAEHPSHLLGCGRGRLARGRRDRVQHPDWGRLRRAHVRGDDDRDGLDDVRDGEEPSLVGWDEPCHGVEGEKSG